MTERELRRLSRGELPEPLPAQTEEKENIRRAAQEGGDRP